MVLLVVVVVVVVGAAGVVVVVASRDLQRAVPIFQVKTNPNIESPSQ